MFKTVVRTKLVAGWIAVVVFAMAASAAAGADITFSVVELWLIAGIVPPAIMLLLWKGAPPMTVAELLHDVDSNGKDGKRQ